MTQTVTPASASLEVTLHVNGTPHTLSLDPRVTLLQALREHLHLTGAKQGCERGQCGTCTVLVDGRRVYSCLALAVSHDGDAITTIEGLATESLHALQSAFIEHDAFQCGYCTCGQIVSAAAMLDEAGKDAPSAVTPRLSEPIDLTAEEIRERMSGNLCRCGAYVNIVAAVRAVAGGR
jgi:xanthine dehydrogenase YagT iron-sulfur-binding subunit